MVGVEINKFVSAPPAAEIQFGYRKPLFAPKMGRTQVFHKGFALNMDARHAHYEKVLFRGEPGVFRSTQPSLGLGAYADLHSSLKPFETLSWSVIAPPLGRA